MSNIRNHFVVGWVADESIIDNSSMKPEGNGLLNIIQGLNDSSSWRD
jgi:hypothetical protein